MDDVVRFELYQNPSLVQMGRRSPEYPIKSISMRLYRYTGMWIDINLGNAENNVSSTIGWFNLMVLKFLLKSNNLNFWSSFIRNFNGYPYHEKSFNDEVWINQALMNALTLFILKNKAFVKSILWFIIYEILNASLLHDRPITILCE